ncbi:MAG: hypothetical protein J6B44_02330, partial [Muribaculaceae bacterium]|nr:hypothetical protein [Muribaculaceae bacterium]
PKTDRALDIALEVAAAGRKTLYVNVDRKIGLYADRLSSPLSSSNLLFATPNFNGPDDSRDYADIVFELIERAVKEHQIETFVIDSVSRIAALSTGRNASVKRIMKRLSIMQMRYGISILAVAHIDSRASLRSLLDFVDSQIDINPPKPEKRSRTKSKTPTDPEEKHAESVETPTPAATPTFEAAPQPFEAASAAPVCQPTIPMTRAQRREAERRHAKLMRRAAARHAGVI